MKIIFLDIDGVLNSGDNLISLNVLKEEDSDQYGQFFDDRCVRYLKWIIQETGAYIVISSSWRLAGLQAMKQLWEDRKLPGFVSGITPRSFINEEGERESYNCRGEEIAAWLKQNNLNDGNEWVIIDDDSDMLEDQTFNFVHVDGRFGLTYPDVQRVITVLGTKNK
jgi:hypothetical protein